MQYVNLGRTGLKVSRICLGCMTFGSKKWREWVIEEEESRPVIKHALDLGINFFDTADMYSLGVSEEITGRALKDFARRDEIVLATKLFHPMNDKPNQGGLSRKHILASADDSLRRLQTDYIDLYQIHRWDYSTPIEETLDALDSLVRAGKVRYIGASSMFAWQFAKSLYISKMNGGASFVSMQDHYNLVYREEEREMLPLCIEEGIGVVPWSPLARGFLAGNRTRQGNGDTLRAKTDEYALHMYYADDDFAIVDRVVEVAKRNEVKPTQVALSWMLHKPHITSPIIGSGKTGHLQEAVDALSIKLSDSDLKYLEEPYRPHRILGHS